MVIWWLRPKLGGDLVILRRGGDGDLPKKSVVIWWFRPLKFGDLVIYIEGGDGDFGQLETLPQVWPLLVKLGQSWPFFVGEMWITFLKSDLAGKVLF